MKNNSIVTIWQQGCQIRQYVEQYCDHTVHHIAILDNITIIYDNNIVQPYGINILQHCDNIFNLQLHNNIVIIYGNNIDKDDHMVNKTLDILFTILLK